MKLTTQLANWLETHWVTPAFAGWLLGGLALFFFGAATNTMAGWLYVMSGVTFALLGTAAILPRQSLLPLKVHRYPIQPVSQGDQLTVQVEIENSGNLPKTLLQVQDVLPVLLGKPVRTVIETIEPQDVYRWTYYYPTRRRGVYRWSEVQLRTAAPLGLFWCRRPREAHATAVVYPMVLPLTQCPLVDQLGAEYSPQFHESRHLQMSTEGITRTLRSYRHGDSTRLIHWRTSARFGELRVRELEVSTGGQDVIIALDSSQKWKADFFEEAVTAAASLYFYASRSQLNVHLWTAATGLVHGNRVVLEVLAEVMDQENSRGQILPNQPMIWLTQNSDSLNELKPGSRWVLWLTEAGESAGDNSRGNGLLIYRDQPLGIQLQASLGHH